MEKKPNSREVKNRIAKVSDRLFGDPEEVDATEADELLAAAGLDSSELENRMYSRLHSEAQKHWMKQEALPHLLKKALADLRPTTAPARNEFELTQQAKSSVERLIEVAKLLPTLLQSQTPTFATAYRRKGELTDTDKDLIERAKIDLQKKLRRMGDKNDV
jgi:hypothetical protein